jgi:nucleoside-diphosphate-sugar epimerase
MSAEGGLHIVLGGSGSVGSAVVRLLMERPVALRAVNRSGRIPFLPSRVPVVAAEAVAPDSLRRACAGATVIYHCIHPSRDDGLLIPITRYVIDAAAETGALLVAAGNMDPYGAVDGPLAEDAPLRPVGAIGRIHQEASALVAEAHALGRVRAVIGRAGHCYGPFSRRVWPGVDFEAALSGRPTVVIGDMDAPHSYTYVDDFARGLITLAEQEAAWGKVWHIPGAPALSPRAFIDLLYAEAGNAPRLRARGRVGLSVRSVVSQEADRLRQMLHQFDRPFVVDAGRFEAAFGAQPTPHHEGIRRTMAWRRRRQNEARAALLRAR